MGVVDLLRLQWRRRWRAGKVRVLLRVIALGLLGAYVGFLVGWMGLVFPDTVAQNLPQRAPSTVLNEHLMGLFGGLLVARFFLQRSFGSGWRACLSLPVRRTTLAWILQGISAISLFNLLSLVGIATLGTSTVAPAATNVGTIFWATGTLLMVGATQLAHTLLRAAWARRAWSVLLGGGAAVVGLLGADVYGVALVRDASGWLFGGLQQGHVLPLVVLGAGTGGVSRWSTATLRQYTYDWGEGAGRDKRRRRISLDARGQSPLSSLVLLEVKLMLRNRGPAEHILAGMGAVIFFVGMIVEGAIPTFSTAIAPFILGLLLPVSYGQFAFAWHGGYFDGLLTRVSPKRLVRAALLVLIVLAGGPGLPRSQGWRGSSRFSRCPWSRSRSITRASPLP